MDTRARIRRISKRTDGIGVTFIMPEDMEPWLREVRKSELVLEIARYSPKRSLQANAYLWRLCTEIGKKLVRSKDDIYLMQLQKYGIYTDVIVKMAAVKSLERLYRFCEILQETDNDSVMVRCYIGSHTYSRAEMAVLLNGTVADAQEMGISTWDPLEIEAMIKAWKG